MGSFFAEQGAKVISALVCYAAPPVMTSQGLRYLEALQDRHLKDLKFSEVTRALRALSAGYVEKREEGGVAKALDGRGKRAAFGLYYGTTHFLAVEALIQELGLGFNGGEIKLDGQRSKHLSNIQILDLGCGTGVCGAAWSLGSSRPTNVLGVDRSSFALHETRWTYNTLRIQGDTSRSISETLDAIRPPHAIVLGWTLNELDDARRDLVGERIAPWVARGSRLLIVEPISKRVTPWWDDWIKRFPLDRCVVAEKRLRLDLPPKIALLARSAGLGTESTAIRVMYSLG